MQRLKDVLSKFRDPGTLLNPQKCCFGVQRVEFLGHVISDGKCISQTAGCRVYWVSHVQLPCLCFGRQLGHFPLCNYGFPSLFGGVGSNPTAATNVKGRRRFIRILSTTMKHNHMKDNSAGKTNISVDGWHSHPIRISYTLADNLHLAVHP